MNLCHIRTTHTNIDWQRVEISKRCYLWLPSVFKRDIKLTNFVVVPKLRWCWTRLFMRPICYWILMEIFNIYFGGNFWIFKLYNDLRHDLTMLLHLWCVFIIIMGNFIILNRKQLDNFKLLIIVSINLL